jgi:serine/threonine-protein kinase
VSRVAHSASSNERFAPGDLLLERYRVIGLLGKGGMGEVYRADDLKLGQPVALKFLPAVAQGGADRLERFYNEARMAREVSHPAVCRVHDIGEAGGQHFLSMEYVDGEDLATLVRRIGRLPADKATEIARQVCAGIAAAHAKGVLHRDLKPQNVMLDGRGKARITDFGLAGLAAAIQGDEIRSGTPAYMSPEQLAGREVTLKSDLYALGLVLYEVFTGRRAYPGRSLTEIRKQHEEPLPPPSELVADIPRVAEEAILACLDPDPRRRPPSALAVSAMLSGGDALAAALAAGETPSPEMVAAAGRTEGMRPVWAWTCLVAILASTATLVVLSRGRSLIDRVPGAKAPAVLEDRARTILGKLGYAEPPVDRALGYGVDWDYFRWAERTKPKAERFHGIDSGEPALLYIWYRQSPRPLVSERMSGAVYYTHPPLVVSGMAGVRLDLSGRLLALYAVPPQVERDGPASEPDWSILFEEAGLDPAAFEEVEPRWTPSSYGDARAAWEGVYPRRPDIPLRIEAAAHRGRPVSFHLIMPWTRPDRMEPFQPAPGQAAMQVAFLAVLALLITAGAFLARRNTMAGRGDRRGAFRLAAVIFVLGFSSWLLHAHHVADREGETRLLTQGTAQVLLTAAILWLLYLALEPYVRRSWPHTVISWTRLLGGAVQDPLVGRDALLGAVWGASLAALFPLTALVPEWLGHGTAAPSIRYVDAFLGPSHVLRVVVAFPLNAIGLALAALLLLTLLKLLLRRERRAAFALALLLTGLQALEQGAQGDAPLWLKLVLAGVIMGTFTMLLLGCGLLSAVVGLTVVNMLLTFHLDTDFSSWRSGPTVDVFVVLAVLVAFAFRASQRSARPPGGVAASH